MNSFSGYTNLPATVIAAPVPGTCLPGNQDRLRRWNVARSTLQRGRKSDWAISGLGCFSLAVFEKLIAGVIHFLSRLRYGIMITGLRERPVALVIRKARNDREARLDHRKEHYLWSGSSVHITTADKQEGFDTRELPPNYQDVNCQLPCR